MSTAQLDPNIRVGGVHLDLLLSALGIDEHTGAMQEVDISSSGSHTIEHSAITTLSAIVLTFSRTFTVNFSAVGESKVFIADGIAILWGCAETGVVVTNTDGANGGVLRSWVGGS